jgi:predicted DNA-binding mobile mystery protein A
MRTPVTLLALELFDKELPQLRQAAQSLLAHTPADGWVKSIRKSLGISMRSFSGRLGFKDPSSVNELEHNERAGTITLQTLRRAAEAMDADFVYAIIPRKNLRDTVAERAREVARRRLLSLAKSMALEEQPLTQAQIDRQVDELARELEKKPGTLWR